MQHEKILGDMARMLVDRLIYSPMNSKDIIKLSLDTPLSNCTYLNILCPGVVFWLECN